jgi:hypothetical protein
MVTSSYSHVREHSAVNGPDTASAVTISVPAMTGGNKLAICPCELNEKYNLLINPQVKCHILTWRHAQLLIGTTCNSVLYCKTEITFPSTQYGVLECSSWQLIEYYTFNKPAS